MPAQTPEEVDALVEKYINENDLEALVDLYEPTATLMAQGGIVSIGHDAIRTALQRLLNVNAKMTLNVTQTIVSGDVAVLYNEWSYTFSPPGSDPVEFNGQAMEVVRRQADGSWRFVIDDPYGRGDATPAA